MKPLLNLISLLAFGLVTLLYVAGHLADVQYLQFVAILFAIFAASCDRAK